jgi:hypothetical protein
LGTVGAFESAFVARQPGQDRGRTLQNQVV